jgi:beta-phosphoglucomutase-like phosphatase (HAD superfamily)
MILNSKLEALLFDCDGVIVETEELHRLFNSLFV